MGVVGDLGAQAQPVADEGRELQVGTGDLW